jgi:hypothetical protein
MAMHRKNPRPDLSFTAVSPGCTLDHGYLPQAQSRLCHARLHAVAIINAKICML